MALTAAQRNVTSRVDLGGDALAALGEARQTTAPIVTAISVTNAAKTLATLKGSALAATTRRVTVRPSATGIIWHAGTAVAATHVPLLTDDLTIDGTVASLATITFITAGAAIGAWLIEEA